MINCKNLKKTYGKGTVEVQALRGVDLDVLPGELLMLVGPSGSGKTTLISIIAGILNQTEGACDVLGKDINRLPDTEKTKFRGENIGFVFQALNLVPTLTASENVAVPLLLKRAPQKEAINKAEELLKNLGMADKLEKYPSELSGGQQQRVAIARGVVHNPKVIVCDEPTSQLDHETGKKVMELLRNLLTKERAIIVVTHDSRIFSFADRIAYMDDGQIVKIEKNHFT
jgi:putative ABC transport system ATP-binding protein